jgi:hypothetical protein
MSVFEKTIAAELRRRGVAFEWQAETAGRRIPYYPLYGVAKYAVPDFYLPVTNIHVEVKGQMTLHQVSKMLYLAERSGVAYYVVQCSEEDWDPTIQSLVEPPSKLPPSTNEAARRKANVAHQFDELVHLASQPMAVARINAATTARLRAYVKFFDTHLAAACGTGLLQS